MSCADGFQCYCWSILLKKITFQLFSWEELRHCGLGFLRTLFIFLLNWKWKREGEENEKIRSVFSIKKDSFFHPFTGICGGYLWKFLSFFKSLRPFFSWRKYFEMENIIFHLLYFGCFFLLWSQFTSWTYLVGLLNPFLSVDICKTVVLFSLSRIIMRELAKR